MQLMQWMGGVGAKPIMGWETASLSIHPISCTEGPSDAQEGEAPGWVLWIAADEALMLWRFRVMDSAGKSQSLLFWLVQSISAKELAT